MPKSASGLKNVDSSYLIWSSLPFSTFTSPDFILAMHSLQYTGRPGSGLNGTVVSFLQSEHTVGNFSRAPDPLEVSSPRDIPLQSLISLSTTSLGRQYSAREER